VNWNKHSPPVFCLEIDTATLVASAIPLKDGTSCAVNTFVFCIPQTLHKESSGRSMHYLYGSKPGVDRKLVATFDSEQQLLAYLRWATLSVKPDGTSKFEQGSPLVGYQRWEKSVESLTDDDSAEVVHNPSPSML
jgi:hypothetical protein